MSICWVMCQQHMRHTALQRMPMQAKLVDSVRNRYGPSFSPIVAGAAAVLVLSTLRLKGPPTPHPLHPKAPVMVICLESELPCYFSR
jgi:hypothetical protein